MIVLTFALPTESEEFTRALALPAGSAVKRERRTSPLGTLTGEYAGQPVAVAYTGVGDTPAGRQRLREVFEPGAAGWRGMGQPHLVISSGYTGALRDEARVGDLVLGDNVSDPAQAARAAALLVEEPLRRGRLVTVPAAAETVAAKAELAARTGGLAVDMETAWIAAACAEFGVPLLSLRVVSDAADQPFPVPGHVLFDAARQRPRYVALPWWLLTHPGSIRPFAGFARGLGPARARLTRALGKLIVGL